jgi:hypothetical protein
MAKTGNSNKNEMRVWFVIIILILAIASIALYISKDKDTGLSPKGEDSGIHQVLTHEDGGYLIIYKDGSTMHVPLDGSTETASDGSQTEGGKKTGGAERHPLDSDWLDEETKYCPFTTLKRIFGPSCESIESLIATWTPQCPPNCPIGSGVSPSECSCDPDYDPTDPWESPDRCLVVLNWRCSGGGSG